MGFLNLGGAAGGGGVTRFADLEDVQVDTALDGAAPRYDQVAEVWIAGPGVDSAARSFRGDWQDPADALLWGSDFIDIADLDLITASATASVTPPAKTRVSAAAVGSGTPPPFTYAAQFTWVSPTSATATARFYLNLATLLPGQFVSRAELWSSGQITSSGAATHSQHIGIDGSSSVLVHSGLTAQAWAEHATSAPPGADVQFDLALLLDATTGSLGSGNYVANIAGVRIYGAVDPADLYSADDVVAHNGSFWRSLFNLNSDEPAAASAKWLEIPPIVA